MSLKPRYCLLGHTADLFVCYEAPDLAGLFAVAARSLGELSFGSARGFGNLRPIERRSLVLGPERLSELFLDWLRELLFLLSSEGFRTLRAQVQVIPSPDPDFYSLDACLSGVLIDPQRHRPRLEIKSPTYHRFRLLPSKTGWRAEVLFDI